MQTNGHSSKNSILLAIANDDLKGALDDTFSAHGAVVDARYGTIASTSRTLPIAQKYFPDKQFVDLGHGPDFGDIRAISFMLEQLAAGRRLEALFLPDAKISPHQPFKLVLMLSLLKANVVWWPTPASAAAFFNAMAASGVGRDLLAISGSVSL